MSWGYKILITYVVFVVMMLGMVYVASRQTNEMQDDNYYAKELAYQSVIDGKNNLNGLNDKVTVTNTPEAVVLRLPSAATAAISEGKIYFLRPSNEKNDWREDLKVDAEGEQFISRKKLVNGYYTIQISWKSNGKPYFHEQKFNVQ